MMKNLSSIQKRLLYILIFVFICIFAVSALEPSEMQPVSSSLQNSITISHDSGFYNEYITLEVLGDSVSEIYYTLDGTDPSYDNPTAFAYHNGIPINCDVVETITTLKILAYFQDGSESDIITRTFITGDNVHTRYDVPVLCVSAPEEIFWDEEIGLLYKDHKFLMTSREHEKEVHMTLFDAQGNTLLSQDCGFRIHGNFSRTKNQVSFRLHARSEYDEQNDFDYAFFTNQYTYENTLVPKYKRIIVRNSGNDNGFAFIRTEFASRISLEAGFPDAPCATPVAVYLNNKYNGFYWLVTHYNDSYYEETYGDYLGTMYTFGGVLSNVDIAENETDEQFISLANDYKEQMSFFSSCDLNNEQNWAALNDFMDVENFLKYVAIQNYICNTDSLASNFKVYRYWAAEGEEYRPNSVFDGKYRFLLYDLDHAFGSEEYDSVWPKVDHLTTTVRMTSGDINHLFFSNLLSRKDCIEYYVRYILSLQNYYFSSEYASNVLFEMHESRQNELRYMYQTTDLLLNNHMAPDVTSDEDIEHAMGDILNFLENRSYYTFQDLSGIFGPFTTYELSLENPSEANISLDSANITDSSFGGIYYQEVPLTVTANEKPGYRFEYWLVNDEKYLDNSFEIQPDMIQNGRVFLECVYSPDPDAEICITAIKSNTGNDYIELTNLGTATKRLNDYYLSDDDQWNKSSLPSLLLKGGESIIIYCNNYTKLDALGQPCLNFNLKAGESLSLYKGGEVYLQTVAVPSLGTADGIYAMDMTTGEFKEVNAQNYYEHK